MSNFGNFIDYKQTVLGITADLRKLQEFSRKLELTRNVAAIEETLRRVAEEKFNVAVVGEFKRGKSSLINALLERNVLPTNIRPTTATLNKITYNIDEFVVIEYKDGTSEKIGIDQLNDYVTKLTSESEEKARTVKEATVHYPVPYCKNGVTIIDTPGLNDDEEMTNVTFSVLPTINAALMVISAESPFSEFERAFLESKIITEDLCKVLFVVSNIDKIIKNEGEDKLNALLENIKNRIQGNVIAKAKNAYGEDSIEFESYKRKIGEVKVYGLSAKQALKAKQGGDSELLKASRFTEFENALEKFLTKESGALMLTNAVSRIKTSSNELDKAVKLRECALAARGGAQKEEFKKNCEKAKGEIDGIKRDRDAEFKRISETAERAKARLKRIADNYGASLISAAGTAIDLFNIGTIDELKEPAMQNTQKKILRAVENAVATESQNIAERVHADIKIELQNEAERVSAGFEKKFHQTNVEIQSLFTSGVSADMTVIEGIDRNGALIDKAAGLGILGAAGALFIGLSLPVTWWAIPLIAVPGKKLSDYFSDGKVSKWLGNLFLGDKIKQFKDSFKTWIVKKLEETASGSNFYEAVCACIDTAFDALKDKIKAETEIILGDTEDQLTQLRVNLAKTEVSSEKESDELKQMVAQMNEIYTRNDILDKQIMEVLSK